MCMQVLSATPILGVVTTPNLIAIVNFDVILSLLPQDASYNLQKNYTGTTTLTVKHIKIIQV